MNRVLLNTSLAAALFALLCTSHAAAGKVPTADIQGDYKITGAGCASGTFTTLLTNNTPGGKTDFFQGTFDELDAKAVNADKKRHAATECTLEFDVLIPEGYRIGKFSLKTETRMDLPEKAWGRVETLVWIPAMSHFPLHTVGTNVVEHRGKTEKTSESLLETYWNELPGQRCPTKVKVFVDVLVDVAISPKAAKNAKARAAANTVVGIIGADAHAFSLVPCQ